MRQKTRNTFALTHPTDILGALVGLKDVAVLSYIRRGPVVELVIEQSPVNLDCPSCHKRAHIKERPLVRYVDLPVYGRPMTLGWKKHRMACPNPHCATNSFVVGDHRIAAKGCLLTTRAAKWATQQVGQGRTVAEVAAELGCDWHTVNDALTTYGSALIEADRKRLSRTRAIGLDETSFVHRSGFVTEYATTVADVANHQIIEVLPSRNYVEVARWVHDQPASWRGGIRYGALDMSSTYAAVYTVTLPGATQVVDPFHVVSLANRTLDAVRRRVQSETLGHRGRKNDPLYRIRRVLLMGEEKLDAKGSDRLSSLLELGDPDGYVAIAYRVKERLREFYRTSDPAVAQEMLAELVAHCKKPSMPPELKRLGRSLERWFDKICAYHLEKISNGPTESINNLIKRIKRIGFGFRNFENYRIRVLLYAGKPNWRVLGSIVVT